MKTTGWMTKLFSRLSLISVAIVFMASTSVAQSGRIIYAFKGGFFR